MFSWPRFPSVSLPDAIQRRFISFILRRFLGHLVKPGQLDAIQIDAQIGSGFVQVSDVELDHDAINKHLADLPIPLRLEAGSVGKISARIPWPNLLTAPFALSLSSLSLSFVIIPHAKVTSPPVHAEDGLGESVTSVAESFMHEELTEKENRAFSESLHLEAQLHQQQPPGSINPFLNTEDMGTVIDGGEYNLDNQDEGDADPPAHGVSLLATLVERILSRFEFSASDITLRLVLPRKAEFVIRLGKITYSTEMPPAPSEKEPEDGEVRVITVAGITVTTRDLTPPPPSSSTTSRQRSGSPFSSSSSEEDEEVLMMMSQSIAALPPPPIARSISPGSTMYLSATSSVRSLSPDPAQNSEESERTEEKILSLGLGSEPMTFRLITPPLVVPELQDEPSRAYPNYRLQSSSTNKIRLTISSGPVAIALKPVHVRSLHQLSLSLTTPQPVDPTSRRVRIPSPQLVDIGLQIRGVTILLLQAPFPLQPTTIDLLQHFFLLRSTPPSPPRIPHVRFQLDGFDFFLTSHPAGVATGLPHRSGVTVPTIGISKHLGASLADFSIFAFSTQAHGSSENWTASPILLSDPNLVAQYERDVEFPAFEVVDWTKAGGGIGKVSQWRVRPHVKRRSASGAVPSTVVGSPRVSHAPVMQVRLELGKAGQSAVCHVDVVPLHFFVDVRLLEGAVSFVSIATAVNMECEEGNVEVDDTPPATPRAKGPAPLHENERERERRRLENLLMDDFTDHDASSPTTGTSFVLRIPLFRVQIRGPPPHGWTAGPRSGALVLDLHGICLTHQDEFAPPRRVTRFQSEGGKLGPKVLAMLEFKKLIAATTLAAGSKASTFLSIITPALAPGISSPSLGTSPPAHACSIASLSLPSVCLRSHPALPPRPSTTTSHGTASSFSLDANCPSVRITLSKSAVDALTFWADDISQRLFNDSERTAASDASGRSRDPSLIGSRFFVRTASTGSSESGAEARKSEFVIKVSMAEVRIKLLVPRKNDGGNVRPLEIAASDIDFLAEIKPEGNDETVVTVGVMDLNVTNTSATGEATAIVSLTIPRHLSTSFKSLLKLRFNSLVDSDTAAKESRLKVTASAFTYFFNPEFDWVGDVRVFTKAPEGAFESVIPSERTKVAVKVANCSLRLLAPTHPGALVAYIRELDFSTDLVGDSLETVINADVSASSIFFLDDMDISPAAKETHGNDDAGPALWERAGYALLAEASDLAVRLRHQAGPSVNTQILIKNVKLNLHACADSIPAFGSFMGDFSSIFDDNQEKPSLPKRPTATSRDSGPRQKRDVFATVDEHAFRRAPDLGPAPDMIHDDLPKNLDYLDASFGAAGGLRELRDDDLFEFEPDEPYSGRDTPTSARGVKGVIANFGGETIRMLDQRGIHVVEGHFENIPQEAVDLLSGAGDSKLNIHVRNCDLTISLYDGFDWVCTRKAIEEEVKAIRRRLVKIRQLLASGQTPDDSIEETSTILFNSVYIGLPQDPDELEPSALLAAIDQELEEDEATEVTSQSSWQSFKRRPQQDTSRATRIRGKKLTRSKCSRIEFCLTGVQTEVDQFYPNAPLVSRALVTARDLEILDHIKTSTWKKFLTELRTDFRGNVRETASDMIRAELRIVHPVPDLPTEEGRLRAKILPIKLHVDQDALDFMKKFFSFQRPETPTASPSPKDELYFRCVLTGPVVVSCPDCMFVAEHVEVFPVDIKLDYKPKRVDYKALREGKTIELMNFFHFDGAEITLRHITLSGITGWPRLFETLNDLWTPDVKANQLADIISGVSPVRSLVNVGSGVADLVLLPIAQYKKDKRVVRGVQKGTTSFVKTTAMEAIKLGARLATGTQVILEQAETVLGGQGQFKATVTTEALQGPITIRGENSDEEPEAAELISKYADQPLDVREGMQSAYKSLSKNFNSAAQTILAVPMEVYERSSNQGPVRAVVRAVPIAVLKPMIGASEAVSKTLFGLRNTIDPEVRHENEAKYKRR